VASQQKSTYSCSDPQGFIYPRVNIVVLSKSVKEMLKTLVIMLWLKCDSRLGHISHKIKRIKS